MSKNTMKFDLKQLNTFISDNNKILNDKLFKISKLTLENDTLVQKNNILKCILCIETYLFITAMFYICYNL